MTRAHVTPGNTAGDDEIRDSIRVMHRERNAKLAFVVVATVVGVFVLFLAAYLGFGGG